MARTGNALAEHPAFAGFSEVVQMSGGSGATVALVRGRDGVSFVRKMANAPQTNPTLLAQARRQAALGDVVRGYAFVPEILREDEYQGLYLYDMRFVPSRDAANYLSSCTFDQVASFADRIEKLVACLAATPPIGRAPIPLKKVALLRKLNQISQRTADRHERDLAPLIEASNRVDELLTVQDATASHGDLTFENILVGRGGELYLIDTIESPFDHYWVDWSKLFQECEGRWHAYRGRPIQNAVTWWLRNRFMQAATRLDPAYPAWHYILLGLTFARILPYSRCEEDRSFVAGRLISCGRTALRLLDERRVV